MLIVFHEPPKVAKQIHQQCLKPFTVVPVLPKDTPPDNPIKRTNPIRMDMCPRRRSPLAETKQAAQRIFKGVFSVFKIREKPGK